MPRPPSLDAAQVACIAAWRAEGWSLAEIAEALGTSKSTVARAIERESDRLNGTERDQRATDVPAGPESAPRTGWTAPRTAVEGAAEVWPPPVSPSDTYATVPVRPSGSGASVSPVRLRRVRLWGADVLVDAAGDVYCDFCKRLIDPAEIGRVGNKHHVGLRNRSAVRLVSMGRDDEGPVSRAPWQVGW